MVPIRQLFNDKSRRETDAVVTLANPVTALTVISHSPQSTLEPCGTDHHLQLVFSSSSSASRDTGFSWAIFANYPMIFCDLIY